MIRPLACCTLTLAGTLLASTADRAQTSAVATTRTFTNAQLGLTVVGTEMELPMGAWSIASVVPASAIDQAFVLPPAVTAEMPETMGRRVGASLIRTGTASGQWHVQMYFQALLEYAATHGGTAPLSLLDLNRQKYGYLIDTAGRSPWQEDQGRQIAGPFVFLVPGVPLSPALAGPSGNVPQRPASARTPLLLELRPYVDDGKQWVLYSDGSTDRVAIDSAVLGRYSLTITTVIKGGAAASPAAAGTLRYGIVGLVHAPIPASVTLTLADASTSRTVEVRWTLAGGRADAQVISDWATAREVQWHLLENYNAPILRTWLSRSSTLYGTSPRQPARGMPPNVAMPQPARTTDALGVLGGRAALRETLQMQLLQAPRAPGPAMPSVPVASLKGVDVASLPFDRMLAGRGGGHIALADNVPADRFFVYFAKPSAVMPFLTHGGDFLANLDAMGSSAFDDDLKNRYLRRLGLPEEASKALLETGQVAEVGLVASDLFFRDGTNLTVLLRMRAPALVAALRLVGFPDLKADTVTMRTAGDGTVAYWTMHADVVAVSTSRSELDVMLRTAANPSSSLGQSAEFRYMLTELPPQPSTRAMAYLSDPFIRRMVGPALKIAQLRRLQAAADMTMISAGALLYALDGHRGHTDLATLQRLGYVSAALSPAEYTLRDDFSVVSVRWGTLANLTPIDTSAIDTVTGYEAAQYQQYMNEYRQFWRQYFDPIGLRLDDAPDGALELSTFILPLVDSQLYNQVRSVIESKEHGAPLRVPVLSPPPVVQVSVNLTDESWLSVAGSWSQTFTQYTGVDPRLFDLLGPGMHIAIQDADPIISLGTSEMFGAFSMASGRPGMDIMIPLALSVLTRPCKILVDLSDPARAVGMLRRAARTNTESSRGFGAAVQFRQITGKDAWTYTLGVPGVATLRFAVEVQNGYLVISNLPWSQPVNIARVDARAMNGAAMQSTPEAMQAGLPGLFATQAEQNQQSSLSSMAALLPWLQALGGTPDDAAARYRAVFGPVPLHPGAGSWLWKNGTLTSSTYGSAMQWSVPRYSASDGTFGVFQGATLLDLNMQFESGGLRAICRWMWKEPTKR